MIINPFSYAVFPTYETDSDVVLWFDTANLKTMYTTTSVGSDANTNPAATDTVGHIYSKGIGGLFLNTATNAAGKPTLGTDGFLTWGGTAQILTARSGSMTGLRTYLRAMHGAAPVWSIQFKLKVAVDGTAITLTNSKTGTSTEAGWRFQRTSANKLLFQLCDGTNTIASYTTTNAGFTVANGEISVQLNINGVGTATLYYTHGGADSSETFSVSAGTDGVDCTTDYKFGAANISMAHVIIRNRILTAGEITAYKTYAPALNTDYWYSPRIKFDYDSSCYGETTLTTPSTNGGIVRALKNLVSWPTGYNPGWLFQAASDGASPDYATNVLNGHAAVQYDGTETQAISLMSAQGGVNPENNGAVIHFRIAKNLDADEGSHLAIGQNYYGFSGSNYPSNPGGLAYCFVHGVSGASPDSGGRTLKTDGQVANLVVIQRDGSTFGLWNGTKAKDTGTMTASLILNEVGPRYSSVSADWAFEGDDYYWEVAAGYVPDSFIEHKIDLLNSAYAI